MPKAGALVAGSLHVIKRTEGSCRKPCWSEAASPFHPFQHLLVAGQCHEVSLSRAGFIWFAVLLEQVDGPQSETCWVTLEGSEEVRRKVQWIVSWSAPRGTASQPTGAVPGGAMRVVALRFHRWRAGSNGGSRPLLLRKSGMMVPCR